MDNNTFRELILRSIFEDHLQRCREAWQQLDGLNKLHDSSMHDVAWQHLTTYIQEADTVEKMLHHISEVEFVYTGFSGKPALEVEYKYQTTDRAEVIRLLHTEGTAGCRLEATFRKYHPQLVAFVYPSRSVTDKGKFVNDIKHTPYRHTENYYTKK